MPDGVAEALTRFDTCILADALEKLGIQLHNQGFAQPGLQCFSDGCAPVAGFAATAKIRASDPPITGHQYFRHTDWWKEIDRLPRPRIIVIEDVDRQPGTGACVGQIGAAVFRAMHCAAAITNGSARDIGAIAGTGFAVYAAHLSPSHAYAHLVEHTTPVDIFGLRIAHGDLLVADRHGVLSIPPESAARVCAIAGELRARKQSFVDYCRSADFSIDELDEKLNDTF